MRRRGGENLSAMFGPPRGVELSEDESFALNHSSQASVIARRSKEEQDRRIAASAARLRDDRAKLRARVARGDLPADGWVAIGPNGEETILFDDEVRRESCGSEHGDAPCGGCPGCLIRQFPSSYRRLTLADLDRFADLDEENEHG